MVHAILIKQLKIVYHKKEVDGQVNIMNIAKQILDQRVNKVMESDSPVFSDTNSEKKRSKAFLLLGVAAYLDIDIAEAAQFITDGGNDGGFDAAYIVEAQDAQLHVVLFQSKYTRDVEKNSNFPANAVEKAVNTIRSVFDPSANIALNPKSKEKVDEIRSFILDGYIPYVTFVMLNNGLSWNQDAQNHIDNAFTDQSQVHFVHFCHTDIIGYMKRTEPITTQLSLRGSAIQENFNYKRVILGRIAVKEIYDLMEQYGDRLLEMNIRRYLGKNIVNDGISHTLQNPDKCQNFFFYNNGITMVCEKFSYNALQEKDWIIKMNHLQIINGGQTCKTIHQTLTEHPEIDVSQVYLLIRIYEVSDDIDVIQDITHATNSQNPVDFRDLKSNDERQILLEKSAQDLGYVYKRKRDNTSITNVIPSTVAAEAVFAVWRGQPHLAKYRRNEYFDKYYMEIFDGLNAAQMILAVLIFRYCDNCRKQLTSNTNSPVHRPYSQHFLAYIIGKQLLQALDIEFINLTHVNFDTARQYFEDKNEILYHNAEALMTTLLEDYFNTTILEDINGRTMSAAFRRFDILERYLKNKFWWDAHAI